MAVQRGDDLAYEGGVGQRFGGDVQRDRDRDALLFEPAAALHRQLDHAPVEEVDAAAFFQRFHERCRAQHAVLGMAPAGEGFQAFYLAGRELDLRLEEGLELALLQADADLLEREARAARLFRRARQRCVVVQQRFQPGGSDRLGQRAQQVHAEGLGQGLHREQQVGRLGAGDDHAYRGLDLAQLADQRQAIHARQAEVDDGDVDRRRLASLQRLQREMPVRDVGDAAGAQLAQHVHQRPALGRVGFRHQKMQMRDVHRCSSFPAASLREAREAVHSQATSAAGAAPRRSTPRRRPRR